MTTKHIILLTLLFLISLPHWSQCRAIPTEISENWDNRTHRNDKTNKGIPINKEKTRSCWESTTWAVTREYTRSRAKSGKYFCALTTNSESFFEYMTCPIKLKKGRNTIHFHCYAKLNTYNKKDGTDENKLIVFLIPNRANPSSGASILRQTSIKKHEQWVELKPDDLILDLDTEVTYYLSIGGKTQDIATRIAVDNISLQVQNAPITCAQPSNITYAYTTTNTLQISWKAPSETPLQYEYALSELDKIPTSTLQTTVTSTFQTVDPTQNHYFFIRSLCQNDKTQWQRLLILPSVCNAPTFLSVADIKPNAFRLNWLSTSPGVQYYISTNDIATPPETLPNSNPTEGIFTGVVNYTNTTEISNLSPNTHYYVWLRNVCDGNLKSNWLKLTSPVMTINGLCEDFSALTLSGTYIVEDANRDGHQWNLSKYLQDLQDNQVIKVTPKARGANNDFLFIPFPIESEQHLNIAFSYFVPQSEGNAHLDIYLTEKPKATYVQEKNKIYSQRNLKKSFDNNLYTDEIRNIPTTNAFRYIAFKATGNAPLALDNICIAAQEMPLKTPIVSVASATCEHSGTLCTIINPQKGVTYKLSTEGTLSDTQLASPFTIEEGKTYQVIALRDKDTTTSTIFNANTEKPSLNPIEFKLNEVQCGDTFVSVALKREKDTQYKLNQTPILSGEELKQLSFSTIYTLTAVKGNCITTTVFTTPAEKIPLPPIALTLHPVHCGDLYASAEFIPATGAHYLLNDQNIPSDGKLNKLAFSTVYTLTAQQGECSANTTFTTPQRKSKPSPPTLSPVTLGDHPIVADLPQNEGRYRWYKNLNAPTSLMLTDPITTSELYLSIVEGDCESNRVAVSILQTKKELLTKSEPTFYNAISLSGNSKNNLLYIDKAENYPQNELTIYSSSGVKIYEIKGYNNKERAFRGFSNVKNTFSSSNRLIQGTYFYLFKYTDDTKVKQSKGFLYIAD